MHTLGGSFYTLNYSHIHSSITIALAPFGHTTHPFPYMHSIAFFHVLSIAVITSNAPIHCIQSLNSFSVPIHGIHCSHCIHSLNSFSAFIHGIHCIYCIHSSNSSSAFIHGIALHLLHPFIEFILCIHSRHSLHLLHPFIEFILMHSSHGISLHLLHPFIKFILYIHSLSLALLISHSLTHSSMCVCISK